MVETLIERVDFLEHRSGKKMTTGRLGQRIELHDLIDGYFNVDEMRDLYFECGLDYDNENGTKSNRIWKLIDHYSKRENMLAKICREKQPGVEWPYYD